MDHRRCAITLGGRQILFPLEGFFQSNMAALEELIFFLRQNVQGKILADLFCGAGVLGLSLEDNFDHQKYSITCRDQ